MNLKKQKQKKKTSHCPLLRKANLYEHMKQTQTLAFSPPSCCILWFDRNWLDNWICDGFDIHYWLDI